MCKIMFKSNIVRRTPDPVDKNIQEYTMTVKGDELPTGLPRTPNPRNQNINRIIYREIAKSYRNEGNNTPFTFHLKNHGIDIVAKEVKKVGSNLYEVEFTEGYGVVNGLHTYDIIQSNKDECPNQYVKVHIYTGVPEEFITEMAAGLNTNMQVQKQSLLNHDGKFNWIKETINETSYAEKIAYKENEIKDFDITEMIQIMTLFNIDLFPVYGDSFPVIAYSQKSECLNYFERDLESYKKLQPILKEILQLYDIIQISSPELYGARGSALSFVETRKNKEFDFIFINQSSLHRLTLGAVFPLLAAFRVFLEEDAVTHNYKWGTAGGFEEIKNIWNEVAQKLLKSTRTNFIELGRNPNKLGKSASHWKSIYQELQLWYQRPVNANI